LDNLNAGLGNISKSTVVTSIVGGLTHVCISSIDQIKCLGMTDKPPADLKFPIKIVSDSNDICAIGSDGVQCWGSDLSDVVQYKFLTQFKRPEAVAVSNTSTFYQGVLDVCVLDSGQVTCWNSLKGNVSTDPHKNVTEVVLGEKHKCIIADGKVHCTGNFNCKHPVLNVPVDLKNPRNLTAGDFHSCVITDDGVKCWGGEWDGLCLNDPIEVKTPQVTSPRSLSSGRRHTCALGDEGIKCVGRRNEYGEVNVPENLKNPSAVFTAGERTCVVTDDGVICWGKPIGWHPVVVMPLHPLN
jgi:hypothetical protein